MIKVSIIVPVYKVEKSIDRCIESLLCQTLKEIEIILVDDGSPDRCPQICDKYKEKDNRVKVIHKENGGLGFARNSGMEIAEGEYIGFVDSDDYVAADMYEKLYRAAIKNNADVAYAGYHYVTPKGTSSLQLVERETILEGKDEIKGLLMDSISSDISNKDDTKYSAIVWKGIFNLEIIRKNNIQFYSERVYVSEDGLFDIDFLTKCKRAVLLPDCCYFYIYNPKSITSSYREKRFEQNKALFELGRRKLWKNYREKAVLDQYGRMFLAAARVCIMQEVNHVDRAGFILSYRNVKKICNDEVLIQILDKYPWQKMPWKKRVFSFLMKYKLIILQFVFVKLNEIRIG